MALLSVLFFLAGECFLSAQLYRVPRGLQALAKTGPELATFQRVSPELTRKIFAAARKNFKGPENLIKNLAPSVMQVARPNSSGVLGTGFLISSHKRLWAVMPYHIGGSAGQKRVVRVFSADGTPKEYQVTIAVNGSAGWSSADISLAELPEDALSGGARTLPVGKPSLRLPAYSAGYAAGPFDANDLLPMRRDLICAEGFGLISGRTIEGSESSSPLLISGYCGSPVVQEQNGVWTAVGLHSGGCVRPGAPEDGRGYAVNLSRAVPFLLDNYFYGLPGRPLAFRGWEIGRLKHTERVKRVEIKRGGQVVFAVDLRNNPNPYSDAHTELALGYFVLRSGDVVSYQICNRREIRLLEYSIP